MASRPNILWFCTDQQRYDTIGGLNNPLVQTPHLDRFMQSAVTFTHAFSQSPVCTPSRASFLTSRYPRTCGGRQNGQAEYPDSEVLVTRLLSDAGWDCGLVGKLHLTACDHVSEKDHRPQDGYRNFWWSHHPGPDWADEDYTPWIAAHGSSWQELYHVPPDSRHAYPGVPERYHQTTWCVDMAIEHMTQAGDQPWLMSVNPFDPHHAFDPPQEYLDLYDPEQMPLPQWLPEEWESKTPYQVVDHRGAYGGGGMSVDRLSERQQREIVAAYYAMVTLLDAQFGRLLAHLEATGRRENTIIIFTSDHGEMLGDHGILLKGPHFYDCAVRVPLMMSWPGHWREGVVSDALVELLDLAPTLLEATGQPTCPRFQGRALTPLLTGAAGDHREDVYAEYHHAMPGNGYRKVGLPSPFGSMLRTRDHKVVVYAGLDQGELYDLRRDPGEFHNLWHEPDSRDLREQMVKRCFDRVVHTCDPWPPRIGNY